MALATALTVSSCQSERKDPLSAEARASYTHGIAALEAGQWDAAIKHLRQVQTGDRPYPPLFRDLGRAYAGDGHEAVAVAWLQAYLVAAPQAPDAGAMRAELARLETAGREKARHLLEQALAAVESLPGACNGACDKDGQLWTVAHFTAVSGDITRALQIDRHRQAIGAEARRSLERQQRSEQVERSEAGLWSDYAQGLAMEGDINGAQDVLAHHVTVPEYRDGVLHAVAMYFFEHEGDGEAARKAARQIQQPERRDGMIAMIERQERDGGLRARSRTTVSTVTRRAQAISALDDRRLKHWQDPLARDPANLTRLLAEQALALAVTLRELRVQARKIACCLERP